MQVVIAAMMDADPGRSSGTYLAQSHGPDILLAPATPPAEAAPPASEGGAPEHKVTACHSKTVNSTPPSNRFVVLPVEAGRERRLSQRALDQIVGAHLRRTQSTATASALHRWVSRARGWGTSASSRLSEAFASWRARAVRASASSVIEAMRRRTCATLASRRGRAALHRWSRQAAVVSTRKATLRQAADMCLLDLLRRGWQRWTAIASRGAARHQLAYRASGFEWALHMRRVVRRWVGEVRARMVQFVVQPVKGAPPLAVELPRGTTVAALSALLEACCKPPVPFALQLYGRALRPARSLAWSGVLDGSVIHMMLRDGLRGGMDLHTWLLEYARVPEARVADIMEICGQHNIKTREELGHPTSDSERSAIYGALDQCSWAIKNNVSQKIDSALHVCLGTPAGPSRLHQSSPSSAHGQRSVPCEDDGAHALLLVHDAQLDEVLPVVVGCSQGATVGALLLSEGAQSGDVWHFQAVLADRAKLAASITCAAPWAHTPPSRFGRENAAADEERRLTKRAASADASKSEAVLEALQAVSAFDVREKVQRLRGGGLLPASKAKVAPEPESGGPSSSELPSDTLEEQKRLREENARERAALDAERASLNQLRHELETKAAEVQSKIKLQQEGEARSHRDLLDEDALFKRLDVNGNGVIEMDELTTTLLVHGKFTAERCAEIWSMIDADTDGRVTRTEYATFRSRFPDEFDRVAQALTPHKDDGRDQLLLFSFQPIEIVVDSDAIIDEEAVGDGQRAEREKPPVQFQNASDGRKRRLFVATVDGARREIGTLTPTKEAARIEHVTVKDCSLFTEAEFEQAFSASASVSGLGLSQRRLDGFVLRKGPSDEDFKPVRVTLTLQGMVAAVGTRIQVLLREPFCATITRHDSLGQMECVVDNDPHGALTLMYAPEKAFCHGPDHRMWNKLPVQPSRPKQGRMPGTTVLATLTRPPPQRLLPQQLLVLHSGKLAVVHGTQSEQIPAHPTRYTYKLATGGEGALDLNPFNHCVPRFGNLDDIAKASKSYCSQLSTETAELEDGITGVKLQTETQTLEVKTTLKAYQRRSSEEERLIIQGVHVKTIKDLASILLISSPSRLQGGHPATPILLCAAAGTGKTWASWQLAHELAKRCMQQDFADGVALVPMLVNVQRLVRMIWERGETASLGVDVLIQYFAREYGNLQASRSEWLAILSQALELRALIVVLDGIDEAAGHREDVSRFVRDVLVPFGLRVVCTSRPEGVSVDDFREDFIVLNLQPLTLEQQQAALNRQLTEFPEGRTFAGHLTAFVEIRQEHNKLYSVCFDASERAAIESYVVPDRLFKMGEDGRPLYDDEGRKIRNPEMRQRTGDRSFIKVSTQREPQSKYHKSLASFFTDEVLGGLDEGMGHLNAGDSEGVRALVLKLPHPLISKIKSEHADKDLFEFKPEDATAQTTVQCMGLTVKLGLLVLDRRKRLTGSKRDMVLDKMMPVTTARELWPKIVARTDLIYLALEDLKDLFEKALKELCRQHGIHDDDLRFGSLKDAVRVHEKALSDYATNFDDWDDSTVIPEACVLDVLRARVICHNALSMLAVQNAFKNGVEVTNGLLDAGVSVRFEPVRCKNKFDPRVLDPTRFRNMLNNVRLVLADGREAFAEVQVQHKQILEYNDSSHAHTPYDYFRQLLSSNYGNALDEMLEKSIAFFEQIKGVPVLLSMLVLIFKMRAAGDSPALPTDALQLYCMAIRLSAHSTTEHEAEAKFQMLTSVAVANMRAKRREFSSDHVKEVLDESQLKLWNSLLDADSIPLIKVLENDATAQRSGKGVFQFKHLSFQEALAVQRVVDTDAASFKEWSNDETSTAFVADPFNHNSLRIGGGRLGATLGRRRAEWQFTLRETESVFAVLYLLPRNDALRGLAFVGCPLRSSAMKSLADALKTSTSMVQLSLNHGGCDAGGAWHLAECLKTNATIKSVNIAGNSLGTKGAEYFSECIAKNSTLTSLDLRMNDMKSDGVGHIREALKSNQTLTDVNLQANNTGEVPSVSDKWYQINGKDARPSAGDNDNTRCHITRNGDHEWKNISRTGGRRKSFQSGTCGACGVEHYLHDTTGMCVFAHESFYVQYVAFQDQDAPFSPFWPSARECLDFCATVLPRVLECTASRDASTVARLLRDLFGYEVGELPPVDLQLIAACVHDDVSAITTLGSSVTSVHAMADASPLIVAARLGNKRAIKALLDLSANTDVRDVHGKRAVTYAAEGGFIPSVELLLGTSASVLIRTLDRVLDAELSSACKANFLRACECYVKIQSNVANAMEGVHPRLMHRAIRGSDACDAAAFERGTESPTSLSLPWGAESAFLESTVPLGPDDEYDYYIAHADAFSDLDDKAARIRRLAADHAQEAPSAVPFEQLKVFLCSRCLPQWDTYLKSAHLRFAIHGGALRSVRLALMLEENFFRRYWCMEELLLFAKFQGYGAIRVLAPIDCPPAALPQIIPEILDKVGIHAIGSGGGPNISIFDNCVERPQPASALVLSPPTAKRKHGQTTTVVFVGPSPSYLARDGVLQELRAAFAEFTPITGMAFNLLDAEADKASANFHVVWCAPPRPKGEGEYLLNGSLAKTEGQCIHLNPNKRWALTPADGAPPINAFLLKPTVMHEIGHALGLPHSDIKGAVMFPMYQSQIGALHTDDIAKIRVKILPKRKATVDAGVNVETDTTERLSTFLAPQLHLPALRLPPAADTGLSATSPGPLVVRLFCASRAGVCPDAAGVFVKAELYDGKVGASVASARWPVRWSSEVRWDSCRVLRTPTPTGAPSDRAMLRLYYFAHNGPGNDALVGFGEVSVATLRGAHTRTRVPIAEDGSTASSVAWCELCREDATVCMDGRKVIYFVRHGETAWNQAQREALNIPYNIEYNLNADGRAQAESFCAALATAAPGTIAAEMLTAEAIWTTPLTRGVQTCLIGLEPMLRSLCNSGVNQCTPCRKPVVELQPDLCRSGSHGKVGDELLVTARSELRRLLSDDVSRAERLCRVPLGTRHVRQPFGVCCKNSTEHVAERIEEVISQVRFGPHRSVILVGHSSYLKQMMAQLVNPMHCELLDMDGVTLPLAELTTKRLTNNGVAKLTLDFDATPQQPIVRVELMFSSSVSIY